MIMGFLSVCLGILNIFQQYFALFFKTKFISRYFIVFDTVVSETVSLISFSEYLLLVYKNTAEFYVFLLYFTNAEFISSNFFNMDSLGFSMYKMMTSANKDSFVSFFTVCMLFPFLFTCPG